MIEKYVNEEELKRLLSTLVVVLGALMIAVLFASIIVPGLRSRADVARGRSRPLIRPCGGRPRL